MRSFANLRSSRSWLTQRRRVRRAWRGSSPLPAPARQRRSLLILFCVLLAALATACTAPPPTEEQLRAYAQYAEARATDAAAAEIIAAARATEAAAAQQIAQLTSEAAPPAVVVTATVAPAQAITVTLPLTVSEEAVAAATPVTATAEITSAAALTATVAPTVTVAPTATPVPQATAAVTPTASPTAAATPTPQAALGLGANWPWTALTAGTPAGQATPVAAPTPTPTPPPAGQAIVTTQQANLRSGPGMAFDVMTTARQGAVLDVYGSDAAQNWWRVCCVDGQAGWVSRTIVRFQGDPQAAPVIGPLLPDDLSASWAMRWECHGRGCEHDVCLGQSEASAQRVASDRWLEVERTATWEDDCGAPEQWVTQVDRYSGIERQTGAVAPLFNVWQGADPGPANRVVELAGAPLSLWCTDTRTQEQTQPDGWTAAFEGQACYDTRSGVLALMQYVKRWLYSGVAQGQTFDRQYFGDYEVIQQVLLDTNAPLSGR